MDFDKTGSQRNSGAVPLTRIPLSNRKYIVSDGMFCFTLHGQRLLYCLEIHNETDTARVVAQLSQYNDVLQNQTIAKKYKLETQPIILSVLMRKPAVDKTPAHKTMARSTQPHLLQSFAFMEGFDGDVTTSGIWHNADGKTLNIFPVWLILFR